jgi:hypothetical protein
MRRLALCTLAVAVAVAVAVVAAPAAWATPPEHFTDEFPFESVVDCGTFTITETGTFFQHGTVFFDHAGEVTRVLIHESYVGVFTLSNSSKTYTEKGHHLIDIAPTSFKVSGQLNTIVGDDFRLYDVGRIVFDNNGDVVFASARHPIYSGGFSGADSALCSALSG